MSANSMDPNLLSTEGHFYDCIKLINDDDIYLCKYSPTGSLFAVRKTNLESVELELIREEVSVTRMLQHINLLPFLCCFVNKNQLWTVFPFAEYGCVSVLCQPTGLQELAIAFVIRDTLLALNYLHKRGIVHRAVRGSHILVTGSGRCLLSGLKYSTSVMVDGKWQSAIHQYPTNAEANLNFLAPEVLEQNLLGYNSKSDIYSLGIACCELANGCVPFQNMEPTEMLLDKLIGNFPRPLDSTCDEINSISTEGLSQDVKQKYDIYKNRTFTSSFRKFTIDLCLHFEPHERPSADQLLDHSFIKQVKRSDSTTLLSLIPNIKSLIDSQVEQKTGSIQQEEDCSSSETQEWSWNFT